MTGGVAEVRWKSAAAGRLQVRPPALRARDLFQQVSGHPTPNSQFDVYEDTPREMVTYFCGSVTFFSDNLVCGVCNALCSTEVVWSQLR